MNFQKITFSEIFKKISNADQVRISLQNLNYFFPFLIYGFALIFLLKISQIVLGWHF